MNSDSGDFYSDGSGNIYAQSFNPVSDRARKENIKPFDPQSALQMALALTNYTWRFKGRTNFVAKVRLISPHHRMASVSTNIVAMITPPTGKEFGPMAQDWHQITGLGGGTNISMTSMAGLLLGAVQGLGQKLQANDEQHPQDSILYPAGQHQHHLWIWPRPAGVRCKKFIRKRRHKRLVPVQPADECVVRLNPA